MPSAEHAPAEQTDIREVLADDRRRTAERLSHLTGDFDGIVEASEMVALDDEHDPEGATVAFERAQVTALLRQARDHLARLDLALQRLDEDTYGTCERCGDAVSTERLVAQPTARTCVRCAAAGAQLYLPQS